MKNMIAIILSILICLSPSEKKHAKNILSYEVDLTREKVELVWKDHNHKLYSNIGRVLNQDTTISMIMNAGMYTVKQNPLGLYIENGKVITPVNKTEHAYGNFYMQPNGIFYLQNQCPKISPTIDFKLDTTINYATQSGPLLLINGNFHPKFVQGSKNTHIRNGVGILPNGNPLFAISSEKINFYDFANFFKQKGCVNALYLDGSISRAYIPSQNHHDKGGKFGVMIVVKNKPKSTN